MINEHCQNSELINYDSTLMHTRRFATKRIKIHSFPFPLQTNPCQHPIVILQDVAEVDIQCIKAEKGDGRQDLFFIKHPTR